MNKPMSSEMTLAVSVLSPTSSQRTEAQESGFDVEKRGPRTLQRGISPAGTRILANPEPSVETSTLM